MPNPISKGKTSVDSKYTALKKQRDFAKAIGVDHTVGSLETAARIAYQVVALGVPGPGGGSYTEDDSNSSYLNNFRDALGILQKFTDDIRAPGLKGAINALVKVLENIDVSLPRHRCNILTYCEV